MFDKAFSKIGNFINGTAALARLAFFSGLALTLASVGVGFIVSGGTLGIIGGAAVLAMTGFAFADSIINNFRKFTNNLPKRTKESIARGVENLQHKTRSISNQKNKSQASEKQPHSTYSFVRNTNTPKKAPEKPSYSFVRNTSIPKKETKSDDTHPTYSFKGKHLQKDVSISSSDLRLTPLKDNPKVPEENKVSDSLSHTLNAHSESQEPKNPHSNQPDQKDLSLASLKRQNNRS